MTSREEALFHAAFPLSAAERSGFLERECAGDLALRARLEALLAAHDQPDTVLAAAVDEPRPLPHPDPVEARAEEAVGRKIGRYKLLERIGEGGCGVVYVAEQTEPVRRRVALKLIKPGMDTRQVIARFEAERQALAMMDHPNIAKVLDAGTTGEAGSEISHPTSEIPQGRPFFVMELVRGIKITDYCDQATLTTQDRLDLFIKVCQAIQHAHQKGIIHRDIKPSNILVTRHDGVAVPKVIDFGIAKAIEGRLTEATVYTHLHQFIGTPAYMSPEQAEMSGLDIDTRSDIYSLGVLLYELLTGVTPFDVKTLLSQGLDAMRRTIREVEPMRPSTRLRQSDLAAASAGRTGVPRRAALPADLDWIVMKCLEKDRSRRYETANGLAADLKRHLNDEPVVARPPSTAYRFQKAWRRNKLVFAAGGAVAAALVLGTMVSVWQAGRAIRFGRASRAAEEVARTNALIAEQSRSLATRERDRAEGELWNAQLSESRALRIAGGIGARVEGAALLHQLVKRTNLTGAQVLALRQEAIGQMALVDIAPPTNWVPKAEWMPLAWDRTLERLARPAASNRLEVCAFPSEEVLSSLPVPPHATVHDAEFTPDGEMLVARFEPHAGVVWAWHVDTREVVLRGRGVERFAVSPDSRSVLLVTTRGLVVQPLPATTPWRLLQAGRAVTTAALAPDLKRIAVVPRDLPHTVELWDPHTGQTQDGFSLDFPPERIAWHPDGTRLALGGDRGRLELRTLEGGSAGGPESRSLPLTGHQGAIQWLHFSPDTSLLLSYAWDRSSFLWDVVSGRPLLREPRLFLSRFARSGDRLVAMREWPMSESVATLVPRVGYRTMAWSGKPLEAAGAWISPDGRLLAVSHHPEATGIEGDCLLWDIAHRRQIARLQGMWAQFSADSRTLFTFARYAENRVRSYEVSEAALSDPPADWHAGAPVYDGQRGQAVNTGVFAADGRTLVIAATDAVVFLDTRGERAPRTWGKSAHLVNLSTDGRWIATMQHNHLPALWRTVDGRAAFWGEPRSRIEFSPDSRRFSVATEAEVRILGLDSMRPACDPIRLEIPGAAPPVAWSPDGRMFAVALNRTHPRLFEAATGRELATLSPAFPGFIGEAKTLNFSPDGHWLAAAKNDGETVAWHLPTIREELRKVGLDWAWTEGADAAAVLPGLDSPAPGYGSLFERPGRDPAAPRELINLDAHYNASLTEHWHPGWGCSDLSELPSGVQTLAGVRFDVRGVIQCGSSTRSGEPYPRQVTNMVVGLPAQRLHFLHAATMAAGLPVDFRIGRYVVRYADGQTQDIPLRVGRELADWWTQDAEDPGRMQVAWTGQNAASRGAGRTIRLFKTTWDNPRPDTVVQSLDLVATHLQACPFLVAVTAE